MTIKIQANIETHTLMPHSRLTSQEFLNAICSQMEDPPHTSAEKKPGQILVRHENQRTAVRSGGVWTRSKR